MRIYLAGNFPQMNSKGEEERVKDFSLQFIDTYKRLISFYYIKEGKSVLDLKERRDE